MRQLGVIFSDRVQNMRYQAVKWLTLRQLMLRFKNLKLKKYARATHSSWGVLIDIMPLKSDDGESGAGIVILRILEQADQ